jgi:hypothetical protein
MALMFTGGIKVSGFGCQVSGGRPAFGRKSLIGSNKNLKEPTVELAENAEKNFYIISS